MYPKRSKSKSKTLSEYKSALVDLNKKSTVFLMALGKSYIESSDLK